jgi:hypothetical protein
MSITTTVAYLGNPHLNNAICPEVGISHFCGTPDSRLIPMISMSPLEFLPINGRVPESSLTVWPFEGLLTTTVTNAGAAIAQVSIKIAWVKIFTSLPLI